MEANRIDNNDKHWLIEKLKTCKNLADTTILLLEVDREHLMATQIEYMYELVQQMIDDYCIVRQ